MVYDPQMQYRKGIEWSGPMDGCAQYSTAAVLCSGPTQATVAPLPMGQQAAAKKRDTRKIYIILRSRY